MNTIMFILCGEAKERVNIYEFTSGLLNITQGTAFWIHMQAQKSHDHK